MAEVEELLDFPPVPKLGIDGLLNPRMVTEAGMRGPTVFFGKSRVRELPSGNLMHNLQTERFYKPRMTKGMMATAEGPRKTFTLRGIRESPPYMHDGRLLTLEDAVELFNLIS